MGKRELDELCVRKKKQIIKLIEVAEVTRRIAEAVERRDELSAQMLLDEREAPVRALQETEEEIRAYLAELPESDAARLAELLHGKAAEAEEEKTLAEEVGRFYRLLESVTAMDRQLSIRMGGKRSFYQQYGI